MKMSRYAARLALAAGLLTLALLAANSAAAAAGETTTTTASSNTSHPPTSSSSNHHHRKSSSSSTATQPRQSPISAAATMIGALGSLVPSLVTNVAPLVLLFGLGALMMPSLGLSAMGLLRESRRSANDQQPQQMALPGQFGANLFAQQYAAARPFQSAPQDLYYFTKRSLPSLMPGSLNSGPLLAGLQELLERVGRAIDNADKRYN